MAPRLPNHLESAPKLPIWQALRWIGVFPEMAENGAVWQHKWQHFAPGGTTRFDRAW